MSKEEYDTCRLNTNSQSAAGGGSGARVVAVCDQPAAGKPQRPPFTITFRSFTPQPNGLEFKPGQDYYFITALLGHHTDQAKRFSPCRELNMKVIFKICCKPPAGSLQANLLSAQQQAMKAKQLQQQQQQQVSTTRRPPSAQVVTLRPALIVQQQQQQPITVLPIEVLQPSSSSSSGGGNNNELTSGSTNELNGASSSTLAPLDSERNDIVQNEQPGAASSPSSLSAPASYTSSSGGVTLLQQQQLARARQPAPPSFLPFDPRAAPDVLRADYGRWAPTPLPPRLTAGTPAAAQLGRANFGPAASPFTLGQANEPAPWRLPPLPRPPMQRQALSLADQPPPPPSQQQQQQQQQSHQSQLQQRSPNGGAQSRLSLYPHAVWSTRK